MHFKDSECFRALYEPLYVSAGVDFVLAGHGARSAERQPTRGLREGRRLAKPGPSPSPPVHAYERTHPVVNYVVSPSTGPVYFTLGDGGNVEGPYRSFIDETDPATGVTWCQDYQSKVYKIGNVSASTYNPGKWGPGYQRPTNPAGCPALTYQTAAANGPAYGPGLVADPSNPSDGAYFCPSSQPAWSAHRDPSFGFSFVTLVSDSVANFKWYRTIDGGAAAADVVTYTRAVAPPPSPSPPAPSPPPSPSPPGSAQLGGLATKPVVGSQVVSERLYTGVHMTINLGNVSSIVLPVIGDIGRQARGGTCLRGSPPAAWFALSVFHLLFLPRRGAAKAFARHRRRACAASAEPGTGLVSKPTTPDTPRPGLTLRAPRTPGRRAVH